jgi:hypothetical protein
MSLVTPITNEISKSSNSVSSNSVNLELSDICQNEINETTRLIMSLVSKLKTSFDQYSLDENNMIDYVVRIMTLVDQQKNLSGFEKKAVVIEVLTRLVDDTNKLNSESKTALKSIIKIVVPGVIETIVAATKGLIAVNKKVEESVKKCCFCFKF